MFNTAVNCDYHGIHTHGNVFLWNLILLEIMLLFPIMSVNFSGSWLGSPLQKLGSATDNH